MEYNIRAYVDELFRDAPNTQRAYEMKMELVQNLTDKYNDLIATGKTPEDAYNITIYGIGDITELLEEMKREETAAAPGAPAVHGAAGTSYYTAMYYFRRRSAGTIAVAVAMYIVSVVPCVLTEFVCRYTGLSDETYGVLAVAFLLVIAAIATGMLIWNETTKPKDSDPPEVVIDLYNRKRNGSPAVLRAVESGYWMLVVVVYFLLSFITTRWDLTWLVFVAAPAIGGIIRALAQNKE